MDLKLIPLGCHWQCVPNLIYLPFPDLCIPFIRYTLTIPQPFFLYPMVFQFTYKSLVMHIVKYFIKITIDNMIDVSFCNTVKTLVALL